MGSRPSPVVMRGDAPEHPPPSTDSASAAWLLRWVKGKRNRDTVVGGDKNTNKGRNSPPTNEKGKDGALWGGKMPGGKPVLLQCAPSENAGMSTAPVSSCSSVLDGKMEVSWSPSASSHRCEPNHLVFFGAPLNVEADADTEGKPTEQLRVEATFTSAAEPIDIPPKKVAAVNAIAFEVCVVCLGGGGRAFFCPDRIRVVGSWLSILSPDAVRSLLYKVCSCRSVFSHLIYRSVHLYTLFVDPIPPPPTPPFGSTRPADLAPRPNENDCSSPLSLHSDLFAKVVFLQRLGGCKNYHCHNATTKKLLRCLRCSL